ncbi:MAG: hypothetical protein R3C26_25680 [Calditrichia bacterium]
MWHFSTAHFENGEIPSRDIVRFPHPFISESMALSIRCRRGTR